MKMYKCRKCGEQVLKSAKVCRHCGIDNPVPTKLDYIAGLIVLVAIVWGVVLMINSNIKSKAEQDAQCRQELKCWGEEHGIAARIRCDDYVERIAKYSYEWTDGIVEPKFSRFRWKSESKGYVTYIGDKIKLQNAFGAWQNYIYECDFNPETKTVFDVRLRPGKL